MKSTKGKKQVWIDRSSSRTRLRSKRSTRAGKFSTEVSTAHCIRNSSHSSNVLVSRIAATSSVNRLAIELDVNTDIYPMVLNEFYKLVLATSVNADGSDAFDIIQYENQGSAANAGMGALIDQYEYVMHGKIFKYQLDDSQRNM